MESTKYSGGNSLLDRLPASELHALMLDLDVVTIESGKVLYPGAADCDLEHVYFPIDAVTSMLAIMADGSAVEAGTVGREGLVGAQCAFGSARMSERWIGQVPGTAARMPLVRFRGHFRRQERLRILVGRYLQFYIALLAQSVACNTLHLLVERCARWLLLTHDRVGRNEFALTHEFLAMMLGVRRPGVSVAAATLQSSGSISYTRGNVTVRNRAGLESASCECYNLTMGEYARLVDEPVAEDEASAFTIKTSQNHQ